MSGRPINALELYSRFRNEMNKPDPFRANEVPVDRGFLAPLATYADGQTELAWPSFPVGAVIDGVRSFGAKGFDTPEAIQHNAGAAFDTAGGIVQGGLGVGLAGGLADNAVGSAGGNLARGASDLPMDIASRMARAQQMGFDTDNVLYHGTLGDFDAFDTSQLAKNYRHSTDGFHFSPERSEAEAYAAKNKRRAVSLEGDRVYQANENKWPWQFEEKPQKTPDARVIPAFIRKGRQAVINYDPENGATAAMHEKLRALKAEGYDSVLVRGVDDTLTGQTLDEVIAFNPKDIRRTDAAFDPAMSDSANLLAANAKSGAAVPLIQNALERSGAQPQGIRAYHGSPHDFDRFSLDKIGTGEGAQAYGHGLYFADSEDVAKSYRESLSKGGQWSNPSRHSIFEIGGQEVPKSQKSAADIAHMIQEYKIDLNTPDGAEWLSSEIGARGLPSEVRDTIAEFLKSPINKRTVDGRMYEVNIRANPEDFLDWDKPLSQQSEKVRALFDNMGEGVEGFDTMTGARLYNDLVQMRSEYLKDVSKTPDVDVSRTFAEAGIPGIRYLDGMSRGAGEGSSNYVVFSDDIVDILRKYANAPTASAVPLAGETDTDPALLEYLRMIGL